MKSVICFGLGPIGQAIARECIQQNDVELVAAVDPAGSRGFEAGVPVHKRLDEISAGADTAIFSTTSDLPTLIAQVAPVLERGMDVASTCEELAFPSTANPRAAAELDAAARRCGRSVVGAGVNPGFAMDLVPALASTVSLKVERIEVNRSVNLEHRRQQLGTKLGIGLREEKWQDLERDGQLGHRGLVESARLCALAAGWSGDDIQFDRAPIANDGTVVGVLEEANVSAPSCDLTMRLRFAPGGVDLDVVEVTGTSSLRFEITGLDGDEATVARTVHTAKMSGALAPGLRLPIEVPLWVGDKWLRLAGDAEGRGGSGDESNKADAER